MEARLQIQLHVMPMPAYEYPAVDLKGELETYIKEWLGSYEIEPGKEKQAEENARLYGEFLQWRGYRLPIKGGL